MRKKLIGAPTVTALLLAAGGQWALAQQETETGSTLQGLEEVVVTAQKREQGLQDVPISVQAFSQQRIEALGAQDIGDLGVFTPNVDISRGVNQPSYSIRGIGTSDFGVGADPAVGVYLDGVYIGRSGGSKTAFNDIARVEVLNGPQGTLFGRNAAAGAIQYISNKPVDAQEGWAKITVGDYSRLQLEGMYNMPLSDNLYWRSSFLKNERDGYIDNEFNGKDLNEEDNWSIISSLRWVPTEALDVVFRLEYDEIDQDSRAAASAAFGRREGLSFTNTEMDGDHEESRELFGSSLHLTFDMGEATFTSISSYREYDTHNPEEKDGTAIESYRFDDLNKEDNEQWSQEFRFDGDIGDNIRWLAGFNYHHEDAKQTSGIDVSTSGVERIVTEQFLDNPYPTFAEGFPLTVADLAFPDYQSIYASGQEAFAAGTFSERINVEGEYESWALFADMTWSIIEDVDLTVGIRYTEDEKEFSRLVEPNGFGFWFAWPETRLDANGDYDPNGTTVGWVTQTESWDDTTGRAVLDWRVLDDVLLYASYSQGYKAGGFSSADTEHDGPPFDPEEVDTWEVGFKSTWFDNTLRVNGAYFDYTYDNLQEQNFIEGDCLTPRSETGTYLFETQDVEGDGFELTANWLALPSLEIWGNLGVVDADVVERNRCVVVNDEPVQVDESGAKFADDFKYALGVNYTQDLGTAGELVLSIAWSQEDGDSDRTSCSYIEDLGNGTSAISKLQELDGQLTFSRNSVLSPLPAVPFDSCPDLKDRERLNARLAYFVGDWEVGAWVTNATDWEDEGDPGGLGSTFESDFSDGSPAWDRREEPRMYGMDLRYSF